MVRVRERGDPERVEFWLPASAMLVSGSAPTPAGSGALWSGGLSTPPPLLALTGGEIAVLEAFRYSWRVVGKGESQLLHDAGAPFFQQSGAARFRR